MSNKDLQSKTCKELKELAKEKGVPNRWKMTKQQLITAIVHAIGNEEKAQSTNQVASGKSEESFSRSNTSANADITGALFKKPAEVKIDMELKMPYIENVEIGTIVAFRCENGRAKSAKVVRKSTKNRKLLLETKYGAEFIVPYENVIWVRTGKRWPHGVFETLKGIASDKKAIKRELSNNETAALPQK